MRPSERISEIIGDAVRPMSLDAAIVRYLDEQWETELYPEGGAPPAEHPEVARVKASQLSDRFMVRRDQIRAFVRGLTGIEATVNLSRARFGTISADDGCTSVVSTAPTDTYRVIETNLRLCGWPVRGQPDPLSDGRVILKTILACSARPDREQPDIAQLRDDLDALCERQEVRFQPQADRLRAALDELEAWRAL